MVAPVSFVAPPTIASPTRFASVTFSGAVLYELVSASVVSAVNSYSVFAGIASAFSKKM